MTLGTALLAGYNVAQMLGFLSNNFPNIGRKINQAKRIGYDTKKIVDFFSDMTPQDLEKYENSDSVRDENPWIDADKVHRESSAYSTMRKNAPKLALGVGIPLAAFTAYRALRPLGSQAVHPDEISQVGEQIGFNPKGISMDTQQQLTGPQPEAPPQPEITPEAPIQAPIEEPLPQEEPPNPQALDIVERLQYGNIIDQLAAKNESVETIEGVLNNLIGPKGRNWLKSQTKDPLSKIISDYLTLKGPQKEEEPIVEGIEPIEEEETKIDPETKLYEDLEKADPEKRKVILRELKGIDTLRTAEKLNIPINKDKTITAYHGTRSGDKIRKTGIIKNFPFFSTEEKTAKDYAYGASGRNKPEVFKINLDPKDIGITGVEEGAYITSNIENVPIKQPSSRETKPIEQEPEIPKFDPATEKKGEVVQTKSGDIGTLKGIDGSGALIEVDGKVQKVQFEDLMGQTEVVRDAVIVIDPKEVPEEERSAALGFVLTPPSRRDIMISHGPSGKFYRYWRKDGGKVEESIVEQLKEGQRFPISTGRTYMGAYDSEDEDSRGTVAYHRLSSKAQKHGEQDKKTKTIKGKIRDEDGNIIGQEDVEVPLDYWYEEYENTYTHGFIKKFLKALQSAVKAFRPIKALKSAVKAFTPKKKRKKK